MVVGRLYGNTLIPTGILSASNALTNSDIYSVVSLISSDIAGMQFKSTPYVESVLNKPNPLINQFNFWQSVVAQMLLYGNAYVTINKNGSNQVSGLELLQDYQVQNVIVSDDGSELTYAVHYDDNRQDTWFSSGEILHFKLVTVGSDSNDKWFGKSPLTALAPELGIQNLSNKLTQETLKNGINPSVLLKVPEAQLDKEAKDNIRTGFINSTTGDNLGAPIVLDSSTDLETIGVTPEVIDFLKNVDWTKTQISKAFGVNEAMLNGDGDSQSSIKMIQEQYKSAISRYENALSSELSLKLGVPVNLVAETTDDSLIARYSDLVNNQIISGAEAQEALKERGII